MVRGGPPAGSKPLIDGSIFTSCRYAKGSASRHNKQAGFRRPNKSGRRERDWPKCIVILAVGVSGSDFSGKPANPENSAGRSCFGEECGARGETLLSRFGGKGGGTSEPPNPPLLPNRNTTHLRVCQCGGMRSRLAPLSPGDGVGDDSGMYLSCRHAVVNPMFQARARVSGGVLQ